MRGFGLDELALGAFFGSMTIQLALAHQKKKKLSFLHLRAPKRRRGENVLRGLRLFVPVMIGSLYAGAKLNFPGIVPLPAPVHTKKKKKKDQNLKRRCVEPNR
ncbi:hypothetical protein D8B26_003571 [Coccidioides posadasii str. Silveira]|uniref:uncharacterized protein n=1 Tax=Coccidioides posadasii (strain RMSCC 757 / Silveira) TaxID=443226 RepID=UPI001BED98A1|nr:hypothetical protein D8B26_003571 [Coccidioides posadasii str. Silveira]